MTRRISPHEPRTHGRVSPLSWPLCGLLVMVVNPPWLWAEGGSPVATQTRAGVLYRCEFNPGDLERFTPKPGPEAAISTHLYQTRGSENARRPNPCLRMEVRRPIDSFAGLQSQEIPVAADTVYRLRWKVKSREVQGYIGRLNRLRGFHVSVFVRVPNVKGNRHYTRITSRPRFVRQVTVGSTDWHEFEYAFRTGPKGGRALCNLSFYPKVTGTVWIDDIVLKK